MGWSERRLSIDQCETTVEFDFSESDAIELEKAAFQVVLASIYRLSHGYAFFDQSPWSRENWDRIEERRWVFRQISALKDLLSAIGVPTSDLEAMIAAELLETNDFQRAEELNIASELEHPIQPVATDTGMPSNQGNYWGIDNNGGALTSIKEAAALIAQTNTPELESECGWETEEHFDWNAAAAFGKVLEAVAWPVKVSEHGQLVINGLPPSVLLMLNQRIYPWLFSYEEELALLMDEAVMAGLAKFHRRGNMVVKGEAWDKNEAYHRFEIIWEFEHRGESIQFVRKFRRGWRGNDGSRTIEWKPWTVVHDAQFGYFTLTPKELNYDSPNQSAITNHRPTEPWELFRTRIGW